MEPLFWQPRLAPPGAHPAEQQEGDAAGEKDAARLDFMIEKQGIIYSQNGNTGAYVYRLHQIHQYGGHDLSDWRETPREAIDAAMQAMKGDGNHG
ncbi:hypothetical protein CEY04_30685 [Achromobacter sp. HZ28]|nr:hypothetical protein CEY05_30690 [Achromobacter sp. HZ34]OWT67321.1 hypothetical protein CEY04_30685 [Achromobacter sp. HZ28]